MSGATLRKVNFGLTVGLVALWVAAAPLGWLTSIVFVSHVSMFALVLTAFMGYVASRAEDAAETSE